MNDPIQLIHGVESQIKHLQLKLTTLKSLEKGYIYEYQYGNRKYLARVFTFNTDSVRFEIFAASVPYTYNYMKQFYDTLYYTSITPVKIKDKKNLILYINWPYKSKEFLKIIAGTSRLRLKF